MARGALRPPNNIHQKCAGPLARLWLSSLLQKSCRRLAVAFLSSQMTLLLFTRRWTRTMRTKSLAIMARILLLGKRSPANALKIRNQKRLLWLHSHAELSLVPSSPDVHIDPIIRSVQNIRSGATLRSRFAFGKVTQAAALASTAADMKPTVQSAGDRRLPFGS